MITISCQANTRYIENKIRQNFEKEVHLVFKIGAYANSAKLNEIEQKKMQSQTFNQAEGQHKIAESDLKKIWFAVLLPTHPKQALPK